MISLRRADPSDNFRLELAAGEVRTLTLQAPASSTAVENNLTARLEIIDPAGTVITSNRGALHERRTVVSFVAPADGPYTVRIVPESGRGEYVLGVADEPIPGDFDADGKADGRDLLNLLLHFGILSGADRSQGDADGDGDVDRQDIDIWRENVGLGTRVEPPAINSADSVREPALRRSKSGRASREEAFATSEDWLELALLRAAGRPKKDAGRNAGPARRVL